MDDKFKPSSKDLNDAAILFKDIPQQASTVLSTVQNLINRVQNGELNGSKGINFLNLKSHMLLNYLINMTYLILKKASGKSIKDDPTIERLVELRTVLEKMRPIDQKLKYQIQKLITTASTGNINTDDPLHFKANPENLMNDDSDNESASSSEEQEKKSAKSKIYVPPKIAATFYEEDEAQVKKDKIRKSTLNSCIIEELRQQYDTGPEEIKEIGDHRRRRNEEINERIRYEEEYMIRLPVTKKQKHDARFSNSSALNLTLGDMPSQQKKSSKKLSGKKFKGKRKSFKRKKH